MIRATGRAVWQLLVLVWLRFAALVSACRNEQGATLAHIRTAPGCFSPDSTYTVVSATLSPQGEYIPLVDGGALVVRRISQGHGRDSVVLAAIVPDSVPVERPITRRFQIHSNAFLGLVFDGPVLVFATDSTRGRR